MRFLNRQAQINESIGNTGDNLGSVKNREKRLEILRHYLNKKMLKNVESAHNIESTNTLSITRKKKRTTRQVPDYLKADFPTRGIHEARLEARRLNEGLTGSPTAL
jgi:hypothetical protein